MAPIVEEPKTTLRPADPTELLPKRLAHARPLFDPEIIRRATKDSFVKLNPVDAGEESSDVRGGSGRG